MAAKAAGENGSVAGSHPAARHLGDGRELDVERDAESSESSHGRALEPKRREPSVVGWDGPDDPANPLNWPTSRKTVAVGIVSAITFISPLASSMLAPSIPQVMTEFNSTSKELGSFVVSVYVVGFSFGPLVIAPLSELYGRAPLYHICNILFVIFAVACAVAPNLEALVVFRLLSGLAGSCPLAIGPGSIADLIPRQKRGKVMAAWVFGPVLGPVIGPVAGGYLTQSKGWRWTFWVPAIAGGAVMLVSFVCMRETYASAILDRKTQRLRKETGNEGLRSPLDTGHSAKEVFARAIVRPSRMLIFSPIVFLLSLYMCILYGYIYLIVTVIPEVFQREYGFSTGQVGLSYLGIGAGSMLGLLVSGAASDRLVESLKQKNGGSFKPEYRLPLTAIAGMTIPIGLFWFGWTAQTHHHWSLPIIGTSFLGCGMTLAFVASSTYLVDAFGAFAASAVAASTVLRSLGGAVLPLAGGRMFATLGLGWGSSLLAFISLAMIPVPVVFYRYGDRIREKSICGVRF